MERQITLTLSDQVYQQAEGLAKDAGRSLAELLTDTIELSLFPTSLNVPQATSTYAHTYAQRAQSGTHIPQKRASKETLTDKMYGIVKPILSERELEELYYEQ